MPVDFRLKPAGHHHFRQHLRRSPRPDVRHHGGRLLSGEAAASHPRRPLYDVAERLALFRRGVEPGGADRARRCRLRFDRAVAVWRLWRDTKHRGLGMADRCHAWRGAVSDADAPRGAVAIAARWRCGMTRERFRAKTCPGLDPGWNPVRVTKNASNK